MADDFSLDDALNTQSTANPQQSQDPGQPQQQPWAWGNPAPGQYPGYPGAPPGQYPGYPGAAPGGQQYPGFPGPYPGQQYPGFPGQGFPGFPAPGQGYPGIPAQDPQKAGVPGQPEPPKPSAPVQLKVPYDLPLPSGVVPRLMITIQGTVNPNPKRFAVDFKRGQDIALHINPRFDERPNIIVRNSMIGNRWGPEERKAPKFPFVAGQPFKIQVLCEADHYKVGINNENLFQYAYRVRELHEIRSVCIGGDVTLTDANVTMV
ncbi:lectin, galactoside-binding, soluble, 3 L homeolog [Xenopus laevis]|uniref:Galectin n=2 Tax=Xenopus laevis TaxID=8355 RepID=Q7ZSY1_XENLA|nr:lectin, galactoside-binding, soluble, 3 L homeolog [Xenopus laevis]AAH46662.1 MGC52947 protein [Xenopus laevis]OCT68548.1 hypothetical protein XELAEV_18039849mg [Xenopus laevis]BAC55886.1 galectin family xgalectin-VIIa [Xenopus laevis]